MSSLLVALVVACAEGPLQWASSSNTTLPCGESRVYGLLREGKLFSALRAARSESVRVPQTRGSVHGDWEPVCATQRDRDALEALVLSELGACEAARRLGAFSHGCQQEPLAVSTALKRAAALREAGQVASAERLTCRAVQASLVAGRRVTAQPLAWPRFESGYPDDERKWGPPIHFLSGTLCVKGRCLPPDGPLVRMPDAEFVNSFAPRSFAYPWRMYPLWQLRATDSQLVSERAHTSRPLRWPATVAPDPHTGATISDLVFTRDGAEIWALSQNGRLLAQQTVGGWVLVDLDLTASCPHPAEPQLAAAIGPGLMLAHLGSEPGCVVLVDVKARRVRPLAFMRGSRVALSGNGKIAAVLQGRKIALYDLAAGVAEHELPLAQFAINEVGVGAVQQIALSHAGDVVGLVLAGRVVDYGSSADLWPTLLRLVRPDGKQVGPNSQWIIGYGSSLIEGDFGERVLTLGGRIWDYRGTLLATVLEHESSLLAFFPDGTVDVIESVTTDAYACRFGDEVLPAVSCADYVEHPRKLRSVVYGGHVGRL